MIAFGQVCVVGAIAAGGPGCRVIRSSEAPTSMIAKGYMLDVDDDEDAVDADGMAL